MVHKKILESLTASVLDTAISKMFDKHQDDADYWPDLVINHKYGGWVNKF